MRRAIAASMIIFALCSEAGAQQLNTAQSLYNLCVKDDLRCGSFLMGAATIMAMLKKASNVAGPQIGPFFDTFSICPGKYQTVVNTAMLSHVFMAWLDKHPQKKNENIGAATMEALIEAWPCKNSN